MSDFAFKKPLDIAAYVVSHLVSKVESGSKRVVVSGATLYRKNKDTFDKLFEIQTRYGIDMCGYVTYFLHENKQLSRNKIDSLLDIMAISRYADELKIRAKHQKIVDSFSKSVSFAIEEVEKRKCGSVSEFIKQTIVDGRLAALYMAGKLSPHYLAGIKNFKKIVSRMDSISRDTLANVANQQEQLLSDLRDAFMAIKNISVVSSIAWTERQRENPKQ